MDARASTLRRFEVRVPGVPPGSLLTLTHTLFQTWRRVVQKMESAIHRISIRETNCVIQWIAPFARLSYLTFKSCTWFASPLSCLREYFFSRMSTNFLLFGTLTQNGLLGAESWDKYVYTPSWFPWKPHQISHDYGQSLYSFSDQNVLNTIPSKRAHTYAAHIGDRYPRFLSLRPQKATDIHFNQDNGTWH